MQVPEKKILDGKGGAEAHALQTLARVIEAFWVIMFISDFWPLPAAPGGGLCQKVARSCEKNVRGK